MVAEYVKDFTAKELYTKWLEPMDDDERARFLRTEESLGILHQLSIG